jgi:hypothetical protein
MELDFIQNMIFEIRGQRVMLDFHLAELYEVENKSFKTGSKAKYRSFP